MIIPSQQLICPIELVKSRNLRHKVFDMGQSDFAQVHTDHVLVRNAGRRRLQVLSHQQAQCSFTVGLVCLVIIRDSVKSVVLRMP